MKEKHCGGLAGHFGIDKTLELVRRFYFWPKMQTEIRKYMEGCMICQKEKGSSSNAYLYTPLPISNKPWDLVSMDFVLRLPKTK